MRCDAMRCSDRVMGCLVECWDWLLWEGKVRYSSRCSAFWSCMDSIGDGRWLFTATILAGYSARTRGNGGLKISHLARS